MSSIGEVEHRIEVPGTSYLVDNAQISDLAERKNIVLVPQPSDDPNDPLNWSEILKMLHMAVLLLYCLINGGALNWVGTLYTVFMEEFDVSINQLNTTSGLQFLFLAVGCLMANVSTHMLGRRATYLISTFLVMLASIIFGATKSYGGLMAYSIINGLGIAPMDTTVEVSINDIHFLHQHGRYMAGYSGVLAIGSSFGSILAGYFSPWSWCNYLIIILCGVLLVLEFFLVEESGYSRSPDDLSPKHILSKDEQLKEVVVPLSSDSLRKLFRQRLAIRRIDQGRHTFFSLLVTPFITLRYPAVAWVSLVYSVQICWLSLMGVTISEFYAAPPYNFSTSSIGNLTYAGVIGAVCGIIYLSISDRYQVWRSRRNGGVSEPEYRLELAILPTIINTLGLCLYGFGPAYGMLWAVGATGIGMIYFGILTLVSIVLTYVIECYPGQVIHTMVVILFVRNIVGTVFSWVFQYWLDAMGVKYLTACLAAMCFFFNGFSCVFNIWGKSFRIYTAKWYLEAMDKGQC